MLDLPYTPTGHEETAVFLAVAVVVAALAYLRYHADESLFSAHAAFWHPIRRYLLTPADDILEHVPYLYTRTTVPSREALDPLDITLSDLTADLDRAGYTRQPLASLATFRPTGETERASFARYFGPESTRVPAFLRRYQIHVRPFGEDGEIVPTAHIEYNPWRPDLALPHLFGVGLTPAPDALAADLGIDPTPYDA